MNFLSNNFKRLVHGGEKLVLGNLAPPVRTPHHVIHWWGKNRVIHFFPLQEILYQVPLVIIPPLMVKPDIFDLHPGHSMVGYLIKKGFDVFLVDFGVPDSSDKNITVDDYVDDFIRTGVKKVKEYARMDKVSLLGWSMGGIMIVLYTSLYNDDGHVKNAVIMGSPVDYSKMFPINLMAKAGGIFVEPAMKVMGNIPGFMSSLAFKMSSPLGRLRRYLQLLYHMHDREWVEAYEKVEEWIDGFIPYPGEAFKKFVLEFIKDDRLKDGRLTIRDNPVILKRFKASLLIVAGDTDWIAPADSCTALAEMVSSKDISILRVPLGHLGMVAGHRAPEEVWEKLVLWLSSRSGKRVHRQYEV